MSRSVFALFGCVLALSGCRSEDVFRRLDVSWNRMQVQPRYDAYAASPFFGDGKAMQAPPLGAVPYSPARRDPAEATGKVAGAYVTTFPVPITRKLLDSGRRQFDIICAACHGVRGNGDSVPAKYMGRPPPSLFEARIRRLPPGRIYEVIRDGYGFMPSYATHLSVEEGWGVVAYVRALQRSQHAVVSRLPGPIADELARRVP